MNLITQLATEFLLNKTTLIQFLRTCDVSEEFLDEFRQDRIAIDEEFLRRKMRLLADLSSDESFQDLFCHDDGVHFVFYMHLFAWRFIRFRLSFDVKILALIFNPRQQTVQLMIHNIQIKSFNRLFEPLRFCIQARTRTLIIDEIERICQEQNIPYERLFRDGKRSLTYQFDLSHLKELDQLRERYLIVGNRSILDLIQITYVEHREQTIVFGYRLNTSINDEEASHSTIIFQE